MSQQCAGAVHDGQAKTEALGRRGSRVEAVEFFENRFVFRGWNPRPRIPHLDPHRTTCSAGADQNCALVGVANCVGNQVLQDASDVGRI